MCGSRGGATQDFVVARALWPLLDFLADPFIALRAARVRAVLAAARVGFGGAFRFGAAPFFALPLAPLLGSAPEYNSVAKYVRLSTSGSMASVWRPSDSAAAVVVRSMTAGAAGA